MCVCVCACVCVCVCLCVSTCVCMYVCMSLSTYFPTYNIYLFDCEAARMGKSIFLTKKKQRMKEEC